MKNRNRGYLAFGIVLILAGVFALVRQITPSFLAGVELFSFPLIFVTIGGFLLLLGLLSWNAEVIPVAAVVSTIWLIIWLQGRYELGPASWGYMWALFPIAGGLGSLLAGLLSLKWRKAAEGIDGILFGVIAFVVLSYFMGGPLFLGTLTPALALIGAGIYVILRGFFNSLKRKQQESS